MSPTVDSIHCYPIKGLRGMSPDRVTLIEGRGIEHDRRFGMAVKDPQGLLSGEEKWRPWNYFLTLKRHENLARFRAAIEEDEVLVVSDAEEKEMARGAFADETQRARLQERLAAALAMSEVRLIDSGRRPLWDDAVPITLVNAASADALNAESARFRPNILFSGMEAWREEKMTGQIAIGDALLSIAGGVPRCAATQVNPGTACRDANIPKQLLRERGHTELGLMATVVRGGEVAVGMPVRFESA